MGLEHLTAVLDHSRQGGSRLVVLLIVASYSDQRGEWIVDQATLQKRARLGRRRVQQLLDELVAAGELAVVSHHGRGKLSTYRLLVGTEKAKRSAPFRPPSLPLVPLFPLSPQTPQIPLSPPEKQQQETFGLRPLTGPQSAVFRVNLLLEEAGVPVPTPAQIGLWSKTLGGVEPLLELLGRLVQAGLPASSLSRLAMSAISGAIRARSSPTSPNPTRSGSTPTRSPSRSSTPCRTA